MHRFDGYDIELTKGDSLQFKVTITGRELPEGTAALFTVKKRPRDEDTVIEKRMEIGSDGVVLVGLSSADTDITPRTYYWDLRVLMPLGDGPYEVRTPMEYVAFTILEVIGNV
jgi:hypothetical protein